MPGSEASDPLTVELMDWMLAARAALWRMGWDSNPRWAFTHGGFQDRCLKPLGHPSGANLRL